MSKLEISAKANTPKRRFRSQKLCDAEIEVSAEAKVLLLRKLQNLSQCDRALERRNFRIVCKRQNVGRMFLEMGFFTHTVGAD